MVKAGVNLDLDQMKRAYDGMEDMLNRASQEIASKIPGRRNVDLNVIFFPQIGFLISIPKDPVHDVADYEGEAGEQWDRVFSSAERAYYKDFRMKDLDYIWGDVYAMICGMP